MLVRHLGIDDSEETELDPDTIAFQLQEVIVDVEYALSILEFTAVETVSIAIRRHGSYISKRHCRDSRQT